MEDVFKIPTTDYNIRPGRVLVANPELNDAYFRRSVVLITEHGDEGTLGFVLNKPLNTRLSEVVNNRDLRDSGILLMLGGPVGFNSLHFIHTFSYLIPDSQAISTSLQWGGNFQAVVSLLSKGLIALDRIKFFVGYTGWGAKQLEEELEEKSWAITDLSESHIFSQSERLWTDSVQQLGPRYAIWLNYPEFPEMN